MYNNLRYNILKLIRKLETLSFNHEKYDAVYFLLFHCILWRRAIEKWLQLMSIDCLRSEIINMVLKYNSLSEWKKYCLLCNRAFSLRSEIFLAIDDELPSIHEPIDYHYLSFCLKYFLASLNTLFFLRWSKNLNNTRCL